MGMFDSVIHDCPNCSERIEWQSKAGECLLSTFPSENVPIAIAKEINGDVETCPGCGRRYKITVDGVPDKISMTVREDY